MTSAGHWSRTRLERVLRMEQSLGSSQPAARVPVLPPSVAAVEPRCIYHRHAPDGRLHGDHEEGSRPGVATHGLHSKDHSSPGRRDLAVQLAREIARREELAIRLEGFISSTPVSVPDEKVFGVPVLGDTSEIEKIVAQMGISRIIVALEDRRGTLPTRSLVTLRVQGVRVDDAATALANLTGRISLSVVRPSWFVFSTGSTGPDGSTF